jgi:hypothetical protein
MQLHFTAMFMISMTCSDRVADRLLLLQVTSLPIQPLVPLVDEFAARLFGENSIARPAQLLPHAAGDFSLPAIVLVTTC